jgi:hypothetical protein
MIILKIARHNVKKSGAATMKSFFLSWNNKERQLWKIRI